MNRKGITLTLIAIFTLVTAGFLYAQMGRMGGGGGMMGKGGGMGMGMGKGNQIRHHYVMNNGIESTYQNLANPLTATSENLKEGAELFRTNCSVCHGETGVGDGPGSKGLNPPPANLPFNVKSTMVDDPFLFWTISEGGGMLKSAMPPFKTALSNEQIWKVILHLRQL